jgi:hypothetical protein
MRRDFDIFENFPDGSKVWRTFVSGEFEAKRKLQELTEHSNNEFSAIDIQAGENLPRIGPQKSRQVIKKAANG